MVGITGSGGVTKSGGYSINAGQADLLASLSVVLSICLLAVHARG